MAPTRGKRTRPYVGPHTEMIAQDVARETAPLRGIGCSSWATCADLALLGWTAIDPCGSCVGAAITRLDGPVLDTGSHAANPAQAGIDVVSSE